MQLQLEAMALGMPDVVGHPNRLPFRGLLTLVGTPSQHSPSGSRGHRVALTYKAADAALPSLLGMALDYSPQMDSHDVRRKIGIITEAEIKPAVNGPGRASGELTVAGFLYAQDFPDVMRELRAGDAVLGMSYEIANAWVPDTAAAVWTVTKFTFTGAAVLRRDKAAYPQTWIRVEDAGAAVERSMKQVAASVIQMPNFEKSYIVGEHRMDPETNESTAPANESVDGQNTTDRLAQATQSLAEALVNINAQFESLHAKVDRIVAAIEESPAAGDQQEKISLAAGRLAELEKANQDLKAQAARARRKTLSPLVTTLLAKEGVEGDALIETPVVEKALSGLSIEQRIAVKAELARAGILL
jgi:hypothetical protein